MKRSRLPRIFTLAACILLAASALLSQDSTWSQNVSPLPPPTGFVNDYAGVLSENTKRDLEAKLKNLKETTSPQVEIAVAVVKTTGERPIFDYSLAVARGWGIGSKQDDNPSALLFIAIDDRKYFTQVSKDLEDELPDGVVGSLQRQYLVPEFKKGNYDKGVSDTISAYVDVIRNKGNTPGNANTRTPISGGESISTPLFGFFCCMVIMFVILIIILSRKGGPTDRDRNRWGGGGFGSSGGGGASDALPWVVGGILSSGSGSSSSSDWGGSSGWGGFGGGGDFGGGGAGGDW